VGAFVFLLEEPDGTSEEESSLDKWRNSFRNDAGVDKTLVRELARLMIGGDYTFSTQNPDI